MLRTSAVPALPLCAQRRVVRVRGQVREPLRSMTKRLALSVARHHGLSTRYKRQRSVARAIYLVTELADTCKCSAI